MVSADVTGSSWDMFEFISKFDCESSDMEDVKGGIGRVLGVTRGFFRLGVSNDDISESRSILGNISFAWS